MKLWKSSRRSSPVTDLRQPIEVGAVTWIRELQDALHDAQATTKPVFALFQEVPGCAGCKQFGADVLSNPVVVDAIETAFVPLLVHNNSGGRDAEVLAAYGEPAWNYQVVRFFDAAGVDIIERKDRVWETGPLATRMVAALERYGAQVPASLSLLEQEHSDRLESAYMVQACFWVGEHELGQIDGVVTTEAGFMGGHEVTHVRFDPAVSSLADLVADGHRRGVVLAVFADERLIEGLDNGQLPVRPPSRYKPAGARDQKRQLRGRVPVGDLSAAQLTKLNSLGLTHAAPYLAQAQRAALGLR